MLPKSSSSGLVGCPNRKVYFDNSRNSSMLSHLSYGKNSHSVVIIVIASLPFRIAGRRLPFQREYWAAFSALLRSSDWVLPSGRYCSAQSVEYKRGSRKKKIPGKYNPCFRPLSADSQKPIIALSLLSGKIIESVRAAISVHPASAQPHLLIYRCISSACLYIQGDGTAPH